MKHKRRGVDFAIIKTPQEFFDLGRRRTAGLLEWQASRLSLADTLANAYLQGVADGAQVTQHTTEHVALEAIFES